VCRRKAAESGSPGWCIIRLRKLMSPWITLMALFSFGLMIAFLRFLSHLLHI
jgi:hypothetical protein